MTATAHARGCSCDACNPEYHPRACPCGCEGFGSAASPPRQVVAYRRFLTLDVARGEAGRLLLTLEARHGAMLESADALRDPVSTHWHRERRQCDDETARCLYRAAVAARYDRSRSRMMLARWRWETLSRLAIRAREIARRLGAFEGVNS